MDVNYQIIPGGNITLWRFLMGCFPVMSWRPQDMVDLHWKRFVTPLANNSYHKPSHKDRFFPLYLLEHIAIQHVIATCECKWSHIWQIEHIFLFNAQSTHKYEMCRYVMHWTSSQNFIFWSIFHGYVIEDVLECVACIASMFLSWIPPFLRTSCPVIKGDY